MRTLDGRHGRARAMRVPAIRASPVEAGMAGAPEAGAPAMTIPQELDQRRLVLSPLKPRTNPAKTDPRRLGKPLAGLTYRHSR
jgi:hypothetical protein